jgi:hypothetical protein
MTMVVQVKSASLLANITTGGKIMVTVDKVNWAYTVMSLEAAKPSCLFAWGSSTGPGPPAHWLYGAIGPAPRHPKRPGGMLPAVP